MSLSLYFSLLHFFLPSEKKKDHLYLYSLKLPIQAIKYLYTTGSEEKLEDEKERERALIKFIMPGHFS